MKELMTKVSDYFNERRNDPERQEDHLAAIVVGSAAIVVIILLLLLLWGHIAKERGQEQAQDIEESELVAVTYEEEAAEYMAQNDGQEALRQEYLESIGALSDKVEGLLAAMEQVESGLAETVGQMQEEDAAVRDRITILYRDVTKIVQELKGTQTKLYDLTDLVQIMDQETIPMIREQIVEIRESMEKIHTNIADLYAKIAALEQEDSRLKQEDDKLWEGIASLEKTLKVVLNQNMNEVDKELEKLAGQFDTLLKQLKMVENRIGSLAGQSLQYRYDAEVHTLYLEPYEE